jgi:hypothetical protein
MEEFLFFLLSEERAGADACRWERFKSRLRGGWIVVMLQL